MFLKLIHWFDAEGITLALFEAAGVVYFCIINAFILMAVLSLIYVINLSFSTSSAKSLIVSSNYTEIIEDLKNYSELPGDSGLGMTFFFTIVDLILSFISSCYYCNKLRSFLGSFFLTYIVLILSISFY